MELECTTGSVYCMLVVGVLIAAAVVEIRMFDKACVHEMRPVLIVHVLLISIQSLSLGVYM